MSLTNHPSILYLASGNEGKLREFRAAAAARGITVETVPRFYELPPCVEDGATFEENARKKAMHYSENAEGLVFADDSGLCVDVLGGAPGVHSARYSGPQATDAENNSKLLTELSDFHAEGRSAHYGCVIALARRAKLLGIFPGRSDGLILETPRGSGGYGYDPYFFFPALGRTFAELSPQEKFAASHRGEAFRGLLEFLPTLAQNSSPRS